jgi:hypothetical protein
VSALCLRPLYPQPGSVNAVQKIKSLGRCRVDLLASPLRQLRVVGRVSLCHRRAGIVHGRLRSLELDRELALVHPFPRCLLAQLV